MPEKWKACELCGRLFEVHSNAQRFCDDKSCKAIRRGKYRKKYRKKAGKGNGSEPGAENPRD